MKILEELKRRNVFRVAGVYAVIAWLIIQVVANIAPMLGLPMWFGRAVIVLLAAGFPIAVVFAWAFEMTPDGMKRTANVPAGESIAPKTGRKLDYVLLGGLALVVVMLVADRLLPPVERGSQAGAPQGEAENALHSEERAGGPRLEGPEAEGGARGAAVAQGAPPAASIAVLPFADLSPGKDQEYFSDGISEEILNVLVRIEGLKVASRTSSFQFRSTALGLPAIARELGVRHVLEGSVRKAGDTIRITAQLIDAETDAHLWSETYDRPLTTETVFAIQDEIAGAIVVALRGRLGVEVGEAPHAPAPTADVKAYDLYLRARAFFQARRDLGEADRLLEQATAIDPKFANALAIRGAIHQFGGEYGARFADERDARRIGRRFAAEALDADPANTLAIAVSGLSHLYDRMEGTSTEDFDAIFASFERALELDPNDSNALNWLGIAYSFVGDHEKAVEIFLRCVEVDPALAACRSNLAMGHMSLGRMEAASAVIDGSLDAGAISVSPGMLAALVDLKRRDAFLVQAVNSPALRGWRKFGALYDALSRPGEDHRALAAELRLHFEETDASMRAYSILNAIGDHERPLLLTYHWIPAMRAYRRSPEFKAHMTASGLPAYWAKHGYPPQCRPVAAKNGGEAGFECE